MNTALRWRRVNRTRLTLAAFAILLGLLTLFACKTGPDAGPGSVHVLTTDGDVNVVMDRYIDRGISAAEDDHATAVVIRLDTPGGLSTSMTTSSNASSPRRCPSS